MVDKASATVPTLDNALRFGADVVVHNVGQLDGRQCFAVMVSRPVDIAGCEFVPLRSTFGLVPDAVYAMAGRAWQTVFWDANTHFCPKCGAPLNPDMLFCYRCGAEVSGNTKVPQKAKKVNLYDWEASREFLVQVANRVFEPDEEPYMGEYSGEENRIAAVMEMLKALLGARCTLVESKWGDYYNGLSAEKGEIEWRETVQGHSCDGCYDGGCGGPDFDIYEYRIVKISPEEYEKEKSSAVASGVAIESTGLGERFRINNENRYGITYMKNFQNLSGCYRYYFDL